MHTHSPPGARTRLVVLNAVLLVVLGLVTLSGRAVAQGGAQDRARGNYTMVSGRVQGGTTHSVYILDQANQELVALAWDRNRDRLVPIGYRSLTGDSKTQRGSR